MKNLVLFVLIILSFANCREDKTTNSVEQLSYKNDKFLVESERDVESIDSSIVVNHDDFIRIWMEIFPSFDEAHSIDLDFNDQEVAVYQTTQNNHLYITDEYFKLPDAEKEDYLYQKMKENKTKNFRFQLNKNEMNQLVNPLKHLKQAKYKTKVAEILDGAAFFMSVYEKDTIVLMGTNSPSSHQKNFLKTLFEICQNHAEDSITKRNISNLKEYL